MTTMVDHPGELLWLTGNTPMPITGPCHHDCTHPYTTSIAYGPDLEHYTLRECAQCDCRAWFNHTRHHRTRWLAH